MTNNKSLRPLPRNQAELRAEFRHCADLAISGSEDVWVKNLLAIAIQRGYKAEAHKLQKALA